MIRIEFTAYVDWYCDFPFTVRIIRDKKRDPIVARGPGTFKIQSKCFTTFSGPRGVAVKFIFPDT
jgi:hypothetical protein